MYHCMPSISGPSRRQTFEKYATELHELVDTRETRKERYRAMTTVVEITSSRLGQ